MRTTVESYVNAYARIPQIFPRMRFIMPVIRGSKSPEAKRPFLVHVIVITTVVMASFMKSLNSVLTSLLQIRVYSLLYPQAPTHVIHLEEAPSSVVWSPARPLVIGTLVAVGTSVQCSNETGFSVSAEYEYSANKIIRIFGQKLNIRKSPNYGPVWQHLFRPNIRPNYSDEH